VKDPKNILQNDLINSNVPVEEIVDPFLKNSGVRLLVKREDLNHPFLSGNKWHKLKYNLVAASEEGLDTILTFGGAYSNHIYALAAAGKLFDFKTIGLIRGYERLPLNPTLSFAVDSGMKIYYINKESYRKRNNVSFLKSLKNKYGKFYLIPEGGTNQLGVKGAGDILLNVMDNYDYVCCACGTGGTLAGLIIALDGEAHVLGFSVLKDGKFLIKGIEKLVFQSSGNNYDNWNINLDYPFGGYAKINLKLIQFIESFEIINKIPIEPIYTGKLFYGIYELIRTGYFKKGKTILAIHTGGLQGLAGMKPRMKKILDGNDNK
jgi:1-aminocyclopropane-1-carboxylate deaminase/D-cysteine desulfhydrase-like pyridoxal-dependent ACC family enzyme